ncbi:MAG TPA: hypothetical protein ENK57_23020 [Polyangiaceae bacterium]|nr:hypothetical protein [Polyangiaceae bacterium]
MERHPTTRGWSFPPADRPPLDDDIERISLRELAARQGRFEHHLMVVGEVGGAQIEIATASEPLYFAHANISDEYALALPTGSPMLDAFPLRTFLSDPSTGEDVGRLRHRVGQLVLHPLGWLHWTGRLRPPYEPFVFEPDARRCGLSLVFCASRPAPVAPDRPLAVSPGLEAEAKSYVLDGAPLGLWDLARESAGPVARVAAATMDLWTSDGSSSIVAPRGAWVVALETDSGSVFTTDLLRLPPRVAAYALPGVRRALVVHSATDEIGPRPPSWDQTPTPPFAPFEENARGMLPTTVGPMRVTALDDARVEVAFGSDAVEVPRYWLARMLFRLGLHAYRVGYLETYGGFFYDDRDGHRFGLRGIGEHRFDDEAACAEAVERLYRAVAPPDYVERLR